MKSIADFVEGKIVRLEVGDAVSFARGGDAHPSLGPCEGILRGPAGEATLYRNGMAIGESSIAYEEIDRVEMSRAEAGRRAVAIISRSGSTLLLHSSDEGGEVLHATLRWIGHTILRRKIAD